MRLAIINGSVQHPNGSQVNAELIRSIAGSEAEIVSIAPFRELFTGHYIYFSNAKPEQQKIMHTIVDSEALIFVVPTYFKSLPGALKNFFDIVREKSLYEHKAIAFVASNHKNQDFGARQARTIIEGILEYFDTQAVCVPEIVISDPAAPDAEALTRALSQLKTLQASYRPSVQ